MSKLIVNNELEHKLAVHSFNILWGMLERDSDYVTNLSTEFGITEESLLEAVEELITNN